MNTTKVLLAGAALAALALAGCGTTAATSGATPGAAACKAAMSADYAHALTDPSAPPATRPAACKGLSDAAVTRIATEIMTSATPAPASAEAPATSADSPAEAVARQLGATGIQDLTAPGTIVVSEAAATLKGRDIRVATFASEHDRQAWEQVERLAYKVTDNGSGSPLYAVSDHGPAS